MLPTSPQLSEIWAKTEQSTSSQPHPGLRPADGTPCTHQPQLTDHHAAGLLAEVAPVPVDERLLQLGRRDLSRLVLVDRVEPLLHAGIHLGSGRGAARVAAGRSAAGIAAGRGATRWGTGTTVTLKFMVLSYFLSLSVIACYEMSPLAMKQVLG